MLCGCIVGKRPFSLVIVVQVLSIIVDPLKTRHRPLDHLTPWELVSKQVKWLLGGEDYRLVFVSISPTTKLDFCIRVVLTIWKCPTFTILVVVFVIIVPVNKTIIQTMRTASFFINAVLACWENCTCSDIRPDVLKLEAIARFDQVINSIYIGGN